MLVCVLIAMVQVSVFAMDQVSVCVLIAMVQVLVWRTNFDKHSYSDVVTSHRTRSQAEHVPPTIEHIAPRAVQPSISHTKVSLIRHIAPIGGGAGGAERAQAPPIRRLGGHHALWAPQTLDSSGS